MKIQNGDFRVFELDVATPPGIYQMKSQNNQRHLWAYPAEVPTPKRPVPIPDFLHLKLTVICQLLNYQKFC
jgi:hypothetical protein